MIMSPEESALLVKLQVIKAERDRYLEALEEIAATGKDKKGRPTFTRDQVDNGEERRKQPQEIK